MLIGTFIAGQIANYGQSNAVVSDHYSRELNPLIGGRTSLLCIKVGGTAVVALAADYAGHTWRKRILKFCNTVVWGFVAHDLYVGTGFKF